MKKIFLVLLMLVFSLSLLSACDGYAEKKAFEGYKTEQCKYLDSLIDDDILHSVKIIILNGQNDIKALNWDSEQSLDVNKGYVDWVIKETWDKIDKEINANIDVEKYVTSQGKLVANSFEERKADYYSTIDQDVEFTNEQKKYINNLTDTELKNKLLAVNSVQDIYVSTSVSFLSNGKFVYTAHYTELGTKYMTALGNGLSDDGCMVLYGTYEAETTVCIPKTLCKINVRLENDSKLSFAIDVSNGTVYKYDMFTRERMQAFTFLDVMQNSGAGNVDVSWKDGQDGIHYKDVRYGNRARNVMDIFVPANLDTTRENGVILFIHGGSWTGGNKEDILNLTKAYAKKGYITATMNHTYVATQIEQGNVGTLLTIDEEVNSAFAKIKEMSEENGWKITQSALYGYSSGCHIAYLYAYGQGNEKTAPIPVKFVSGMVGSLDFRAEYWANVEMDGPSVAAVGLNDLRIIDNDNPYSKEEFNKLMDSISPLAFAKKGDAVPSVIAYAKLDTKLIDYVFADALENALNKYKIQNYCVLLPNSGHMTGNNPTMVGNFWYTVDQYLQMYFGY